MFQAKYEELVNHKNDKLYSQDSALCDGTGRDVCMFQAKYQELANHKKDDLYSYNVVLLHDIALWDGAGCDMRVSGQVPGAGELQKW